MLKNNTFSEKKYFLVTHTEKIFVLISIIVFLLVYYYLGITYAIRSLLFAIPIIISSIFIIIFKDKLNIIQNLNIASTQQNNNQKTNLLFISNFLLGIISLCILFSYESRTLGYPLILALMGSNLLLQILKNNRINNILFFIQLAFIQISLAYSLTLKYPFYYGYGDIIAHLKWIEIIAQNFHTSPQFGYSTYYYFPLYHLFFAISSILTGMTIKEGTYLISGILMTLTSILAYQITYNIVKDYKFSLITSLFFAFSREIIFYSAYFISRSFAFVLVMYIMYIITSSKKKLNKQILLVLFTFSLTLAHQTTMVYLSFILFILLISSWKFNKEMNKKIGNYFLLYTVGYIGYWLFGAQGFIKSVILSLKSETEVMVSTSATEVITQPMLSLSSLLPEYIFLLNRIDLMASIFCISITAYLYIIKPDFFKQLIYILIPCFVFCIFYFPNPTSLFIESTHLFLSYRLPLLITVYISLLSAMGLVLLYKSVPNKRVGITLCCIFFLIFSSFSIINEMNSSDIQIISNSYEIPKNYYTNEEMASYNFLNSNSKNVSVYSDEHSNLYLEYFLFMHTRLLNSQFFSIFCNEIMENNNYILLRIKEMNTDCIKLDAGQKGFGIISEKYKFDSKEEDINKISEENPNLKKKALIYNNKDIYIYI